MARDTEPSGKGTANERPDENVQGENGQGGGFAQLGAHHKALRALLGECAGIGDAEKAGDLPARLSQAWASHADAHGALYDAAVEAGLQEFPLLNDIAVETDLVSFLLHRVPRDLDGPLELAGLRVASRLIQNIIEREEKPRDGLLAKARAAGVDPDALGRRIRACTSSPPDQGGENRPHMRHLTANQEDMMPRHSSMPERDEYGRFVSDDDHRGGGGRSRRYDDDRERDSRGRFTSDRDDDRYGSRGRSSGYDDDRRYSSRRYDDDDDRGYSRGRGQGGWFGDPRGHAEAARRGWDHRRDDDDDRYSSRGRSSRHDDDRRYSSRRYDDDDDRGYSRDRGQGGWFGDPEGHSEASRRGWDHRRDDDDDDRRYSRGRR